MVDWICYTDGSVRKDVNASTKGYFFGGWGLVMLHTKTKRIIERASAEHPSTIGKMEMVPIIEALKILSDTETALIFSDSQYVVRSVNEWIAKWKTWNWMRGDEPIKNRAYLEVLDHWHSKRKATVKWIRGHSGVAGNERADLLATRASQNIKKGLPYDYHRDEILSIASPGSQREGTQIVVPGSLVR